VIAAVVFDLDGVLLQSEEVWDDVRERYVRERGGRYDGEVQRAMMGMSAPEWSAYLHEHAGVSDEPDAINQKVVERMLEAYRSELPLLPGAIEAVRRTADAFPLGLASSSNRGSPGSSNASAPPSRRRRSRAASPHRTSTSRRPDGSRSRRSSAPRSRTRTPGSARPRRPACESSRSRTRATRRTRRRSGSRTPSSAHSTR